MQKLIKERQRFERLVVSKEDLLDMFAYNKYKMRVLEKKVTGDSTTIYRCGTLIDLCLGPHIRHTGRIKAFKMTKVTSVLFVINQKNISLMSILNFLRRKEPFTSMAM